MKKHGSSILTYVSVAGVIGTGVMVAKATPKALQVLEEAKKEKGEDLTLLEKINAAGPVYIPSVLIGASTIACIIGANVLNRHYQASLMSAYALLDQSFKDYKKKVVELYGEEADAKVEEELAKDSKPGENDEVFLFFDERSGQYFESTLFKVQEAEYRINRQLMMSDYASLNDWYELLDLDIVEDGYILGWTPSMLLDYYWQPWLTDDLYLHPRFKEFFDDRSGECIDGLYPTVTLRQIMWALKMKPVKKERWETCFDRRDI